MSQDKPPAVAANDPQHPSRRRRHGKIVGAAPGTLLADPQAPRATMRVIAFAKDDLVDRLIESPKELQAIAASHAVTWLDVVGIRDVEILREIAEVFSLHRLAVEDVASPHQRAKVEDYGDHEFLVLRMLSVQEPLQTEQLSLFVGQDFVVTFQERAGDCWDEVRKRLLDERGRLRTQGADYLAYALLDAVVDAYFPVLEHFSDVMDSVEERVLGGHAQQDIVQDLHDVRRHMLTLRRALWPLREASATLVRGEMPHFGGELRPYLRDVHDHVVQLLDLLENYREMGSSLMEVHLSTVSNRLNEVMKVLTIIATIFIPLTFLVGVYGMNFRHMPEYDLWWTYPALWLLMLGIATGMLWWFRRRHWL